MREILLAANYEDRCEACQSWQEFDGKCELEQISGKQLITQQLKGCKRAKVVCKCAAEQIITKFLSCCVIIDLAEITADYIDDDCGDVDSNFRGW